MTYERRQGQGGVQGQVRTWMSGPLAMGLSMALAMTMAPPGAASAGGAASAASVTRPRPADVLYTNGVVYTVDAANSRAEALAVRDGRIAWVGDSKDAQSWAGPRTRRVDLGGRFLMPGLIDGHMHPQSGGMRMLSCNLEYKALTVPQFQARIQACLDAEPQAKPDDWLLVINWFELAILPAGTVLEHGVLDALHTTRPIVVHSTYGHTSLSNARGLALAGITRDTPDPKDGLIARTPAGEPTGLLEDAAQELVDRLRPEPTAARNLEATRLALRAMREQGITSFLDASTDTATLESYTTLHRQGEMTARGHFAVLVDSAPGFDAGRAVAGVLDMRRRYDQGLQQPAPGISVDTAKLFLDGVYNTPAFTSFLLQPYFENRGTAGQPDWRPGTFRGPNPYFTPAQLEQSLLMLAAAGINPHMHADADGAVREALDAVAAMRRVHPGDDIRPAIAHDEIVHPDDFPRYAQLNVLPVLSFQWEKPAADLNARDSQYLGPVRLALVEPAGLLALHGARIAYGSDWPVDPLDEWLALQVAVTRSAVGEDAQHFPGRLGIDPGLTLRAALRAITIDAAYSLRQDEVTGSLEPGKFADFVVLDRNPLESQADQVSSTRTLLTVVGGKVVYRAVDFPGR